MKASRFINKAQPNLKRIGPITISDRSNFVNARRTNRPKIRGIHCNVKWLFRFILDLNANAQIKYGSSALKTFCIQLFIKFWFSDIRLFKMKRLHSGNSFISFEIDKSLSSTVQSKYRRLNRFWANYLAINSGKA